MYLFEFRLSMFVPISFDLPPPWAHSEVRLLAGYPVFGTCQCKIFDSSCSRNLVVGFPVDPQLITPAFSQCRRGRRATFLSCDEPLRHPRCFILWIECCQTVLASRGRNCRTNCFLSCRIECEDGIENIPLLRTINGQGVERGTESIVAAAVAIFGGIAQHHRRSQDRTFAEARDLIQICQNFTTDHTEAMVILRCIGVKCRHLIKAIFVRRGTICILFLSTQRLQLLCPSHACFIVQTLLIVTAAELVCLSELCAHITHNF